MASAVEGPHACRYRYQPMQGSSHHRSLIACPANAISAPPFFRQICQRGFSFSINAIFFARVQPFTVSRDRSPCMNFVKALVIYQPVAIILAGKSFNLAALVFQDSRDRCCSSFRYITYQSGSRRCKRQVLWSFRSTSANCHPERKSFASYAEATLLSKFDLTARSTAS